MKSFSGEDKKEVATILLFEFIERISRFHLHLEEIQERFYPLNNIGHSKIPEFHLLDPYRECLIKLLRCSLSLSTVLFPKRQSSEDANYEDFIEAFQSLIKLVSDLHTNLGFLPRPPEPPELRRFGRILAKHSMKLSGSRESKNEESEISIYIDEKVAEQTLYEDPLSKFKEKKINKAIDKINEIIKKRDICKFEREPQKMGFHVTIPRIDANNSCRWPTLVHELAHKILKSESFKDYSLINDFEKFLNTKGIQITQAEVDDVNITAWIEECWCDLIGAMVMGPSFWFSQATAFISAGQNTLPVQQSTHPPYLFRLQLTTHILRHRFQEAFFKDCEKSLSLYQQFFDYCDFNNNDGFRNNTTIKYIFDLFRIFFIDHFDRFFIGNSEGNSKASQTSSSTSPKEKHITALIKYTSDIREDVINHMVLRLGQGAPVPSYRVYKDNLFQERPSHVQEVLLAAWLYRNNDFKKDIIEEYKNILNRELLEDNFLWETFCDTIVIRFKGFNFSVLRSIQVGEWSDLLGGEQKDIDYLKKKKPGKKKESRAVLSDYEIYELLKAENLLVIPLINLSQQLGSTSLDIRLGTSFQVFYPNQVGIIDLTDSNSIKNANRFSNLIDLDFMESITLAPGQFILGHSMEYIELPEDISAEVEGRSSFARLGIEVHMTASLIDTGFQGVLTFEIFNAGPNPIKLYPGLRIGQLRFFFGSPPCKPYNKKPTAKYRGLLQHHNSLQSNDYEVDLFLSEKNKKYLEKKWKT